jgi:murein DD-endopeptidase MepM/ murein hydrolase activator NlpD
MLKHQLLLLTTFTALATAGLLLAPSSVKAAGEYIIEPPCAFSKSIDTMNTAAERNHPALNSRPINHAVDIQLGGDCGNNNLALAGADGTVTFKYTAGGYGYHAFLKTSDGRIMVYAHLVNNSRLVSNGAKVKTGQAFARIGCTGNCDGAHIHFEVRDLQNRYLPNSSWKFGVRPYKNDSTTGDTRNQTYGYNLPPTTNECPSTALTCPVYRFVSQDSVTHFYTISTSERDTVVAKYPKYIWRYERIAFNAFPREIFGTEPVHRFWSPIYKNHFYILGDAGKQRVIDQYPSTVWEYEKVAFYAFRDQTINSNPVYRFWSAQNQTHFYTTSVDEKNKMITDSRFNTVWHYEGVAFYIPGNVWSLFSESFLVLVMDPNANYGKGLLQENAINGLTNVLEHRPAKKQKEVHEIKEKLKGFEKSKTNNGKRK